jgi:hypothetical protein
MAICSILGLFLPCGRANWHNCNVAWWLLFACRFSAHSGVRNRGDPDFGMLEFWMLDEIRDVCQAANFQDPLPTFKSLYKIAKEKGKWQQVALPCLA